MDVDTTCTICAVGQVRIQGLIEIYLHFSCESKLVWYGKLLFAFAIRRRVDGAYKRPFWASMRHQFVRISGFVMFKLLLGCFLLIAGGGWAFNHGQDLVDFQTYEVCMPADIKNSIMEIECAIRLRNLITCT